MRDVPIPRFEVGLAIVAILVLVFAAGGGDLRPFAAAPVADVWAERGAAATRIAQSRPGTVSFAVVDAAGAEVAAHNSEHTVSAASTIKAMILAAYLRQPDVASRELTAAEEASLTNMITWSSNADATRLLQKAGWEAMDELAVAAGMQDGYSSDHGSWGLTQISAGAIAAFFHQLPVLLPPAHRDFALGLFGEVVPGQQWGMASATPDGWSWHIKGGWISEVVNQIGTFTKGGQEFTVAVTIEGEPGTGSGVSAAPDSVPAVRTIELITAALFGDGEIPTPDAPTPDAPTPDAPTPVGENLVGATPGECGSAVPVENRAPVRLGWSTGSTCEATTAAS